MIRYTILLTLILSITACGLNEISEQQANNPNIRERQIAFKNISGDIKELKDILENDKIIDKEKLKTTSAQLLKHAHIPFEYFGENDKGGNSRSNIWNQNSTFIEERDKFIVAVVNFNQSIQKEEIEKVRATFTNITATCKSCHDLFKFKSN